MRSLGILLCCLVVSIHSPAQYKGPRDYFPKNNPAPPPPNTTPPATPKPPATPRPAQRPLTFKDLKVEMQFYLYSDTNRTIAWKKVSATTAKNLKNGKVQEWKGTTVVRR